MGKKFILFKSSYFSIVWFLLHLPSFTGKIVTGKTEEAILKKRRDRMCIIIFEEINIVSKA